MLVKNWTERRQHFYRMKNRLFCFRKKISCWSNYCVVFPGPVWPPLSWRSSHRVAPIARGRSTSSTRSCTRPCLWRSATWRWCSWATRPCFAASGCPCSKARRTGGESSTGWSRWPACWRGNPTPRTKSSAVLWLDYEVARTKHS